MIWFVQGGPLLTRVMFGFAFAIWFFAAAAAAAEMKATARTR